MYLPCYDFGTVKCSFKGFRYQNAEIWSANSIVWSDCIEMKAALKGPVWDILDTTVSNKGNTLKCHMVYLKSRDWM
jgi:hypothetical protein